MTTSSEGLPGVKALFFDVFGTVVDWRSTVTRHLTSQCQLVLSSDDTNIPSDVRAKAEHLTEHDWADFAAEWRGSYHTYVQSVAKDPSIPYKSIDEHHLDSLKTLLEKWQLQGLYTPSTIQELSTIWHNLDPWPDSSNGIKLLNTQYQTSTLSNGNIGLLSDMAAHAHLSWTHILSSEMFGTFKPNPKVYVGAAEKLGLRPDECAMVAAHLGDLKAAMGCGLRTCYVERAAEEAWSEKDVRKAKDEGWVGVWIELREDGFVTLAKRLGIE